MRRTNDALKRWGATACAIAGLLAIGCAAPRRPIETMAKADLAVEHAQDEHAVEYAPAELRSAQSDLASARVALDAGRYTEARRWAEDALAEAELAEAKAKSNAALAEVHAARETVTEIETQAVAHEPRSTVVVAPAVPTRRW